MQFLFLLLTMDCVSRLPSSPSLKFKGTYLFYLRIGKLYFSFNYRIIVWGLPFSQNFSFWSSAELSLPLALFPNGLSPVRLFLVCIRYFRASSSSFWFPSPLSVFSSVQPHYDCRAWSTDWPHLCSPAFSSTLLQRSIGLPIGRDHLAPECCC